MLEKKATICEFCQLVSNRLKKKSTNCEQCRTNDVENCIIFVFKFLLFLRILSDPHKCSLPFLHHPRCSLPPVATSLSKIFNPNTFSLQIILTRDSLTAIDYPDHSCALDGAKFYLITSIALFSVSKVCEL